MKDGYRWDGRLEVGSEVIDNQHKVLFDLIKDLRNAMHAGVGTKVVDTLFGVLRDYAFAHFQSEEEYLASHHLFNEHCLEHYRLLKVLNGVILDYRNGRVQDVANVSDFLESWLLEHIVDFDRPHLAVHGTVFARLEDMAVVDEFESDVETRRRHPRIPHNEVVDGDIHANIYNASSLRNGRGKIIDMSPGGLMLEVSGRYRVDDLLLVGCTIGKSFKMEEKVQVRSASGGRIGVEFVLPSAETVEFFTRLYGSVRLGRARLD